MSSLTTLARPYANAAFDVARSAKALGEWDQALNRAAATVADGLLAKWLKSPGLDRAQAVKLVSELTGSAPEDAFTRYLEVLADNDRLALLPQIAEHFGRLREGAEGRLKVRVVSAIPLEAEQAERMSAALRQRFDCDIELHNEVDASVLGGAVIYAGDQVIDGSLKGRLAKLQSSLA